QISVALPRVLEVGAQLAAQRRQALDLLPDERLVMIPQKFEVAQALQKPQRRLGRARGTVERRGPERSTVPAAPRRRQERGRRDQEVVPAREFPFGHLLERA